MIKIFYGILKVLVIAVYPLLIFLALKNGIEPRFISIIVLVAAVFQLSSNKIPLLRNIIAVCLLAVIAGLWFLNSDFFLKLYPVIISLSLLAVFGLSLKFGPPVAEKFARIRHKDLPEYAVKYCRKVTQIWCGFFVINAAISFYTGFLPINVWVLYNGLISYILIGLLMAGEFAFRLYYMKKQMGIPTTKP